MVEKEEGEGGPGGISEEEAAQYDRQIRLWGLEAQKRCGGGRWRGVGNLQGAYRVDMRM
uniref:Uncharacterized protein n=1 Tax=Pavo cristatus TaxID=9049 RepID=A0A8C9LCT0_PAVCR